MVLRRKKKEPVKRIEFPDEDFEEDDIEEQDSQDKTPQKINQTSDKALTKEEIKSLHLYHLERSLLYARYLQ